METQHLRTFIEVVRQGSFAGAARRLDLASSQVTRAIAALRTDVERGHNDARWLRERQARERMLPEVVRQAALRFRGQG